MRAIEADRPTTHHLARVVLVTFMLTFIAARILVFLIMTRKLPDLYLYLGGTHIHHLNYGIFTLAAVGGFLLFTRDTGRELSIAAFLYGFGMALTFDEFGMWVHLGGGYWQRASFDAVVVVAGFLALIGFSPSLENYERHHWTAATSVIAALIAFFVLWGKAQDFADRAIIPKLQEIERVAPQ